jgi:hypothetical protein
MPDKDREEGAACERDRHPLGTGPPVWHAGAGRKGRGTLQLRVSRCANLRLACVSKSRDDP